MSLSRLTLGSMALLAALTTSIASAPAADNDWQQRVGETLGKPGQEMQGGVYRVGLPRTDLHVKLDGVEIRPALALGSWLAFKKTGADEAMVMGDLVLTEKEVNPVMKKLEEGGIEITALHNHLLRNEPFTMYMHVLGHGDPGRLAGILHAALAESGTPLGGSPAAVSGSSQPPVTQPQEPGFDTAIIDRVLGHPGKASGGVYAVNIPRAQPVREGGMEVPAAMGSAIGINFQSTGGGKVATTGDFVLVAQEVNPVVKALRENGIEVTAVHNHMLADEPRLFFLHFWANDEVEKVAKGLRAALDKVDVKRASIGTPSRG
jgi:biotin operon repressor